MNEVSKFVSKSNAGFTMIELMISMAILLVISSAAIGGMTYFQKNYRGSEERKSLQSQLRATIEQMSQEIGQAGLVPSGLMGSAKNTPSPGGYNQATVSSSLARLNVAATPSNSFVVTNSQGMYKGEWLIIDTPALLSVLGAPEELIQIQNISTNLPLTGPQTITTTTAFSQGHAQGAPVMAQGVYPSGVWTTSTLPDASGNAQTLTIFGDINADGTMVIVKYVCPTTFPGPLTRQQFASTNPGCGVGATPDLTTTLIDNITSCQFTYPRTLPVGNSGGNYATSVGISLTVQSQNKDPQTGTYLAVTKNILNIQPRNIVNAYNMDTVVVPAGDGEYKSQFQQLPADPAAGIVSTTCIP